MRIRLPRHGILTWLALVAILAITFAPSASRLLAGAGTPAWTQVCSATGADPRSPFSAPGQPAGTQAFEHCPYCALHAGLVLPPDPRTAAAGAAAASRPLAPAFPAAPRTSGAWPAAQARAPPAAA
jgi:hypothetical protein